MPARSRMNFGIGPEVGSSNVLASDASLRVLNGDFAEPAEVLLNPADPSRVAAPWPLRKVFTDAVLKAETLDRQEKKSGAMNSSLKLTQRYKCPDSGSVRMCFDVSLKYSLSKANASVCHALMAAFNLKMT